MNRFKHFTASELEVLDEALCKLNLDEDEFYSDKQKKEMMKLANKLHKELPKQSR